ncbi:MAG: hypothetical protein WD469_08330 [Paenibacillaceae bacterium]
MNGLITKTFEIRDSATFIPVIATQLRSTMPNEAYLLRRAGYQNSIESVLVMVTRLSDCLSANDSYEWGNRTMQVAHVYIEEHFAELMPGTVVDVQFILGETKAPKVSERLGVLR